MYEKNKIHYKCNLNMQPKYGTNANKQICNLNMQPMQRTNVNKRGAGGFRGGRNLAGGTTTNDWCSALLAERMSASFQRIQGRQNMRISTWRRVRLLTRIDITKAYRPTGEIQKDAPWCQPSCLEGDIHEWLYVHCLQYQGKPHLDQTNRSNGKNTRPQIAPILRY